MRPVLFAAGYLNVDIVAPVDRVPGFGGRVIARSISRHFGGMTANAACAAARLGQPTWFFGSAGEGYEGDAALEELRGFGVNTEYVLRTEQPTSVAIVLVDCEGDRAIVTEPISFDYRPLKGAIENLKPGSDGCVHVDGHQLPEAFDALRKARERGLTVSADLDGLERVDVARLTPRLGAELDAIFLNGGLAGALASEPEDAAARLVGLGAEVVSVTLGERGAVVAWDGGIEHVAAPAVEVRDTTGAGDVFAGAFLAAWIGGAGAAEAARFAVVAGAISVGGAGARGCLPEKEDVLRVVREQTKEGVDVSGKGASRDE
jgi:ribokinase